MNDEDGDITASDKDRDIVVSDKDGDIAASDKDRDSLMSDTSSSWRDIELIRRPSTEVPGECAPGSQKWFGHGHMVSWTRHWDGRLEDVGPGIGWWKFRVGKQQKKVIRA